MPNAPLARIETDDLGDADLEPVRPSERVDEAERRLWCAVIERAYLDATRTHEYLGEIGGRKRRFAHIPAQVKAEARAWLRSSDRGPGSFRALCDSLGLPAAAILGQLGLRWDPLHSGGWSR